MDVKYFVKSETSPHLYLVADVELGNRKVPYAFKSCRQVIYEIALFDTKAEAIAACEEASTYCNISYYVPIILETIV